MNILCVDSTSSELVIAIKSGDKDYFYVSPPDGKKHNKILLPEMENLLNVANLDIADIDCYGVVVGPGSFTGIRIGVATINALAKANNKKLVTITSLETLFDKEDTLALLDCKNNNYYAGLKIADEISYLALTKDEVDAYSIKKVYYTSAMPETMLKMCYDKVLKADFTKQAKPFYLKVSSAERETGIIC